MKNQPCRGGYCETSKNRLSFKGRLNALEFDTFEDFCSRCDEIIYIFKKYKNEIDLSEYKEGDYEVPVLVEGADSKATYTSKISKVKIRISLKCIRTRG